MDTQKLCRNCQTPLAADAPQGLCPACLMKVAMETGTLGQAKPNFTPPSIEEMSQRFSQLEIIGLIGHGGMGAVYKARQKELDRVVALKILPPGVGNDAAFAERFTREAKALAKLNHPGIVTLYEFGMADSPSGNLYFFLMEFVDGMNLRQLLVNGRVSPREALAIVPQICDALQFAHDQGIVHRDIKPENILIDRRGRVKVADFGLAKIVESESGRTDLPVSPDIRAVQRQYGWSLHPQSGCSHSPTGVMGTPNYMAPEQVEHPADVDHRADIYALGVVFYQMLTGELPGKRLEAPSKKVHIDVRLDEVVLRALEKKPDLRYQQASEVKTMVETIATTQGNNQRNIGPYNPWELRIVTAGMMFFMILLFVGLESPRLALPITILCVIGLGICALRLAGVWPGPSILFPRPNFSSRNLHKSSPKAGPQKKSFFWVLLILVFLALAIVGLLGFSIFEKNIAVYQRNAIVNGVVIDSTTGKPIAGARVDDNRYGASPGKAPQQAWTDLTGRYELKTWPEEHTVAASAPGYETKHQLLMSASGNRPFVLDFKLTPLTGSNHKPQTNDPSQLTQEGWQLWQKQELVQAVKKFQQAVQLAPNNADAWNGLGWATFNSGNTKEAEKAFQKVLSFEPSRPAALNGLGQIYLSQRKYEEAEQYLLKAAPQAPAAWFGLARLYLLQAKFPQAEEYAQRIVDSGQGDEIAKQMLQAAKEKHLSEGLRLLIEPKRQTNGLQDPDASLPPKL